MELVKVHWQRQDAQWQVTSFDGQSWSQTQSIAQWGEQLADLTQVSMIVAAENYVCQWLELPGVNARHVTKALPFALEENLIDDIEDFQIINKGKLGKFKHRVYAIKQDILQSLLDACELYHVALIKLIPETALIPSNHIYKDHDRWLFNLDGIAEGAVPESMLAPILESSFEQAPEESQLTLCNTELDSLKLLKSQLETNFADKFSTIDLQLKALTDQLQSQVENTSVTLLTGKLKIAEPKKEKIRHWWQPIPAIAAAWLVIIGLVFIVQSAQMDNKQRAVRDETKKLYKQLFPGERIQSLERQLNGKLNESGGQASSTGLIALLHNSVKTLQDSKFKQALTWQSFRYNDRQGMLQVELNANDLSVLQNYKQALEQVGLAVEIASAVNEGQTVKGRLKISNS